VLAHFDSSLTQDIAGLLPDTHSCHSRLLVVAMLLRVQMPPECTAVV
jgi:hypothetical protein